MSTLTKDADPFPRTRPIAVGALMSTVCACTLIVIQAALDYNEREDEVTYPEPTVMGTFKAFGSVMYAYAGASTFPTIQADMKKRDKFNIAAVAACVSKHMIDALTNEVINTSPLDV